MTIKSGLFIGIVVCIFLMMSYLDTRGTAGAYSTFKKDGYDFQAGLEGLFNFGVSITLTYFLAWMFSMFAKVPKEVFNGVWAIGLLVVGVVLTAWFWQKAPINVKVAVGIMIAAAIYVVIHTRDTAT